MKWRNIRGRSNNVAVLEGVVEFASGNETTGVGDVGHEPSTLLGRDLLQLSIVPVAGIGRGTANDETRLEDLRLVGEASVVNQVGLRGDGVWERLEVNRGGGHFLLGGL